MGPVRITLRRWFLGVVDEAPNQAAIDTFLHEWKRKEWERVLFRVWKWELKLIARESTETLRVRHATIIDELKRFEVERRSALQSVFQAVSVTLAFLGFVGFMVALVTKAFPLTPLAFAFSTYMSLILMLLVVSYMPNPVKALARRFIDTHVYVVKYAVAYPKQADGGPPREEYPGELSWLSQALSLCYDLNVRNRILDRWRAMLGIALIMILAGILVGLVLLGLRIF